MAEPKTKVNDGDVNAFLDTVTDETQRADAKKLLQIFNEVTGEEPKMWGASIIGWGTYHYVYASGREGDWMATGFSPRKQNLTLYIMNGFQDFDMYLEKLGEHSTGKSCLYIRKLEDIDEKVLREMIKHSYDYMTTEYKS